MLMKTIYLVDLVNDVVGHYHIMKALHNIPGTVELDTKEVKYSVKTPVRFFKERIRIILYIAETISKPNIQPSVVHFITADKFYFLPFFFGSKYQKHKVLATIHRIPKSTWLRLLLKWFARRVTLIIVLSDYLLQELNDMGIDNAVVVPHPAFYDCSDVSKQTLKRINHVTDNDIVFSVLGGTRYDKGLDIVLESFKYIPEIYKRKIILNVAGKEQDFKRQFIMDKALKYNIRLLDNIRILSDVEFKENIAISDYILIPYRRTFNATSGPMSEAFGNGIPCILPSHGVFKAYADKQGNGLVFESENPESLAHCMVNVVDKGIAADSEFKERFSLSYFISKHRELYESI